MARLAVVIPYSEQSAAGAAAVAEGLLKRADTQVLLAGPGVEAPEGAVRLDGVYGRGAAVRWALEKVDAPVTVLHDPDPAWSPDALDLLLAPIERDEADVVVARRAHLPPIERGLAQLTRLVSNAAVHDPLSGQRAFRTELLREVTVAHEGDEFDAELVVKLAAQLYRFREVGVEARPARRAPRAVLATGRALLRYATTHNDADNAHEGYTTLSRMESGAPHYNAWLGSKLREHAGPRVLEVGAGIGTITAELAPGREKVVALEVDPFYVRRLQNRFRSMPQVVPYLSDVALADWEKLKAERFDSIVLSNVLEHIPDDAGAVRRFRQILPTGGKVLVVVPALPQLYGALDEAVGHHRRYTDSSLRAVLEGNGFSVEQLEWMNLLGLPGWFVNARLMRRRSIPPFQLRAYDQIAPVLARVESLIKPPLGLSLFCVARARD